MFILRLTFVYSDILDLAKVLRISAIYTVPIAVVIIRQFSKWHYKGIILGLDSEILSFSQSSHHLQTRHM